jgi:hypothetical protein
MAESAIHPVVEPDIHPPKLGAPINASFDVAVYVCDAQNSS